MILKDLRIFSQNVHKSNFLINTILKVNQDFNILFIQEPSWTTLRYIPSSTNSEGIPLLGIPNYLDWLTFARELSSPNKSPRVVMYINIRFLFLQFSFRKDIVNYRDIILTFFSTITLPFGL